MKKFRWMLIALAVATFLAMPVLGLADDKPAEAPKAEAQPAPAAEAPKAEAQPAPAAEAPKAEAQPAPAAEAPKAEAPAK